MVVPVVTYRPGFDTSCMLAVGDHPFIKHQSCLSYGQAKKVYGKAVEQDIEGKTYALAENVEPELLKAMQKALFASKDSPPFALEYAKKRGLKA